MKVSEALFREPHLAYQVALDSFLADDENPDSWNLLPLSGRTLAQESVEGPFEGLFIISARIISGLALINDGPAPVPIGRCQAAAAAAVNTVPAALQPTPGTGPANAAGPLPGAPGGVAAQSSAAADS